MDIKKELEELHKLLADTHPEHAAIIHNALTEIERLEIQVKKLEVSLKYREEKEPIH